MAFIDLMIMLAQLYIFCLLKETMGSFTIVPVPSSLEQALCEPVSG